MKQYKFDEFISPDEGLLEKHVNPIYLNLKFTFDTIEIITNACQVCFSDKFNKKKYTYTYTVSISDL